MESQRFPSGAWLNQAFFFATIVVGAALLWGGRGDSPKDPQSAIGVLLEVQGQVQIKDRGESSWTGANKNDGLYQRMLIYTPPRSSAKLQIGSLGLEVSQDSMVQIYGGKGSSSLDLYYGSVQVEAQNPQIIRVRSRGKIFSLSVKKGKSTLALDPLSGKVKVDRQDSIVSSAKDFPRVTQQREQPIVAKPKVSEIPEVTPLFSSVSFLIDPLLEGPTKLLIEDFNFPETSFLMQDEVLHSDFFRGKKNIDVTTLFPGPWTVSWGQNKFSFQIQSARPTAKWLSGKIHLPKTKLRNYLYDVVMIRPLFQKLERLKEKNPTPEECLEGCLLRITYKHRNNKFWSSTPQFLKIPSTRPKILPERRMASLPTPILNMPIGKNFIRKMGPWISEFGLGGNYLDLASQGTNLEIRSSGFSGPTALAYVEKREENYGIRASYSSVRSNIVATSPLGQSETFLDWTTWWLGLSKEVYDFLPRLHLGFSHQESPLLLQSSTGPTFGIAKTSALGFGFSTSVDLGRKSFLLLDQRVLIPIFSAATEAISWRATPGLEGALGLYRCTSKNWGYGASWWGQLIKGNYVKDNALGSQESASATLFNSSLQMRLIYGACGE